MTTLAYLMIGILIAYLVVSHQKKAGQEYTIWDYLLIGVIVLYWPCFLAFSILAGVIIGIGYILEWIVKSIEGMFVKKTPPTPTK